MKGRRFDADKIGGRLATEASCLVRSQCDPPRFTNGHSKKIDNHRHAVALHYMYYNFCKVHQTLRVTPAMEAGLTDHVWSFAELVGLLSTSHPEAA